MEVVQRSNKHPSVTGHYGILSIYLNVVNYFAVASGTNKVVCVRSHTPDQIEQIITELRDQWGTKPKKWSDHRRVTVCITFFFLLYYSFLLLSFHTTQICSLPFLIYGNLSHLQSTPSIQGPWNPFLDLGDNKVYYTPQVQTKLEQ